MPPGDESNLAPRSSLTVLLRMLYGQGSVPTQSGRSTKDLERDLNNAASLRARVFSGFRQLLSLRRAHLAFAPTAPQRVLDFDPRVFAVMRESADGSDRVLCLHNVGGQPVQVEAREGFAATVLEPFERKWQSAG